MLFKNMNKNLCEYFSNLPEIKSLGGLGVPETELNENGDEGGKEELEEMTNEEEKKDEDEDEEKTRFGWV